MDPSDARSGNRRRAARRPITTRDLELLEFAAHHRMLHAGHVRAFLGTDGDQAEARLDALTSARLLRREPALLDSGPDCYLITRPGLRMIGSELPAPRKDAGSFEHDTGLAWLWLTARSGRFGAMAEVLSERELRSRDGRRAGELEPPLGVKLGGVGYGGRQRLHYPDLVMVDAAGHRIAVELELSSKSARRLETIFAGYALDTRFDAILYTVEKDTIARSVLAAARKFGIEDRVVIQPVKLHGVAQGDAGADGRATGARRRDRSRPPVARVGQPGMEAGR